jgi:hypothetical protein
MDVDRGMTLLEPGGKLGERFDRDVVACGCEVADPVGDRPDVRADVDAVRIRPQDARQDDREVLVVASVLTLAPVLQSTLERPQLRLDPDRAARSENLTSNRPGRLSGGPGGWRR